MQRVREESWGRGTEEDQKRREMLSGQRTALIWKSPSLGALV